MLPDPSRAENQPYPTAQFEGPAGYSFLRLEAVRRFIPPLIASQPRWIFIRRVRTDGYFRIGRHVACLIAIACHQKCPLLARTESAHALAGYVDAPCIHTVLSVHLIDQS